MYNICTVCATDPFNLFINQAINQSINQLQVPTSNWKNTVLNVEDYNDKSGFGKGVHLSVSPSFLTSDIFGDACTLSHTRTRYHICLCTDLFNPFINQSINQLQASTSNPKDFASDVTTTKMDRQGRPSDHQSILPHIRHLRRPSVTPERFSDGNDGTDPQRRQTDGQTKHILFLLKLCHCLTFYFFTHFSG